jgi:enoyl-CoA hydratase/carnithine racemase
VTLAEASVDGGIATLTLNRPDARNALSIQMCEDILVALHEIEADRDVRVLVIRGEGPTFCAGADFAAVSGPGAQDFLPAFEGMLEGVARCRVPTIASIQGGALGGGLQLATVCDFRIVADDARLGIPSARLGILVNFENIQRLVLLAGIALAKEVLMTARTFTGAEAAIAGLVTKSVPFEELRTETEDLAEDLSQLAPLSLQGTKRAIQLVADHLGAVRSVGVDEVVEIDRLVAEAYASEDLQEGLKAMSEKRPPNFTSR